jgi:hypothetical protein
MRIIGLIDGCVQQKRRFIGKDFCHSILSPKTEVKTEVRLILVWHIFLKFLIENNLFWLLTLGPKERSLKMHSMVKRRVKTRLK